MRRLFAPLSMLVVVFAPITAVRAQHDVPVWYIQYDVTIKADHSAKNTVGSETTTTWNFERFFAASAKLDMRNEGSVIAQTQSITADPEKFKNMSQAEMMKYSQDMLAAMQYAANWMPGPNDGATDMLTYMKANSVPVRFHYVEKTAGNNLTDEMNYKYDYESVRTGTASGGAIYPGDQHKFEVNTQSKKYWLLLPYTGQNMDGGMRDITWETVDKTRPAGSGAWEEKRTTEDASIDWLPAFKLELPPNTGMAPVIEGTYTAPDKITGEKTFKGSYSAGAHTVPLTVTYRYTVSSTPLPAKAVAEKK